MRVTIGHFGATERPLRRHFGVELLWVYDGPLSKNTHFPNWFKSFYKVMKSIWGYILFRPFGTILVTFFALEGDFGTLWSHFGITLGSLLPYETHFWSLWSHWSVTFDHFGATLGSLWRHFGCTLEPPWPYEDDFGVTWDQFRLPLGSLWVNFWHMAVALVHFCITLLSL